MAERSTNKQINRKKKQRITHTTEHLNKKAADLHCLPIDHFDQKELLSRLSNLINHFLLRATKHLHSYQQDADLVRCSFFAILKWENVVLINYCRMLQFTVSS